MFGHDDARARLPACRADRDYARVIGVRAYIALPTDLQRVLPAGVQRNTRVFRHSGLPPPHGPGQDVILRGLTDDVRISEVIASSVISDQRCLVALLALGAELAQEQIADKSSEIHHSIEPLFIWRGRNRSYVTRTSMQRRTSMYLSFTLLVFTISLLVGTRAEAQSNLPGLSAGLSIFNQGSGLCLQPTPEVALNGGSITQQSCIPNSRAQTWTVRAIAPERYLIVNNGTGLCLDNTDGNSTDRTPVQQWECTLSTTMQWTITRAPMNAIGYYVIKNVRTGKCLDVRAGSLQAGVVIQIYHCTNSANVVNLAQLFGFDRSFPLSASNTSLQ